MKYIYTSMLAVASAAALWTLIVVASPASAVVSVELGLAEISPNGDAGGYAMPASGSSAPPPPPAPSVSISASPNPVQSKKSFTVSWSSSNASSCSASNAWSGSKGTSGSESFTLVGDQVVTYTVSCSGSGGSSSASVSVTVFTVECDDEEDNDGDSTIDENDIGCFIRPDVYTPNPTFEYDPDDDDETDLPFAYIEVQNDTTGSDWTHENITIADGEHINLKWDSHFATSCSTTFSSNTGTSYTETNVFEPGVGLSKLYSVVCVNAAGEQASDSLRVRTGDPNGNGPAIDAQPAVVRSGDDAEIAWDTGGVDPTLCTLSGPGLSRTLGVSEDIGEMILTISGDSTYTLDCGGSGSDSIRVQVLPEIQET